MSLKDFLYFQKSSKTAVIILLVFIMLTLLFNSFISSSNSSELVLQQNDSIFSEFDEFRKTLKEREALSTKNRHNKPLEISETDYNKHSVVKSETSTNYFPKSLKLKPGETILLNSTDTIQWKKIPGVGSSFSARIVKYRSLLGGFVSKEQLLEVYGVDSEMYSRISPFIEEDINIVGVKVNELEFKDLLRHPYLSYEQVKVIVNLRDKIGNIGSIDELTMFDEFLEEDIKRLKPYLKF